MPRGACLYPSRSNWGSLHRVPHSHSSGVCGWVFSLLLNVGGGSGRPLEQSGKWAPICKRYRTKPSNSELSALSPEAKERTGVLHSLAANEGLLADLEIAAGNILAGFECCLDGSLIATTSVAAR
jgi:hypothetical protein